MAGDGAVDIVGEGWEFGQRVVVAVDQVVDFRDMHAVVGAVAEGDGVGGFHDDAFRAFDDGPVPEVGGTEIEPAVGTGRAAFQDDDVDGVDEAAVVVRDLAEVDGR